MLVVDLIACANNFLFSDPSSVPTSRSYLTILACSLFLLLLLLPLVDLAFSFV